MLGASPSPPHVTVRIILAEARRLFAARGFDGVSISDVATAAAVSKANIFHHFGTKQALYMEVLTSSLNEFGELTDHLQRERAPIEQRLHHFLLAHAAHLQKYPEAAQVVLRELLENRSEITQQLAEQAAGAQFRRLFELVQEAQRAGEIRAEVDPAALVVAMIGAVVFQFQVRSLLRHQPEVEFADDPKRYSRLLAEVFVNGIHSEETTG